MTRVREGADLPDALETAFETAGEVLIESGIMGRELTCGVLDGDDSEGRLRPQALPVTEICPVQSEYFDYTAKYTPGACQEITPANLSEADTARVQAAALTAHCGLGCRGMSRSDFMLAPDGDLYILETNTIPGMTPTSLLPQAAAAAGLDYLGLCEAIIASALRVSHVL